MPACVGLPSGPCPHNAKGKEVKYRYAELDLCPHCERTRRELDGAFVGKALLDETKQRKGRGSASMLEHNNASSTIPSGYINSMMHGDIGACGGPASNTTSVDTDSDDDITLVKSKISSNETPKSDLFLQPLIAYVIFSFQSSSYENIKLAVLGHFSIEQITQAKNIYGNFVDLISLAKR